MDIPIVLWNDPWMQNQWLNLGWLHARLVTCPPVQSLLYNRREGPPLPFGYCYPPQVINLTVMLAHSALRMLHTCGVGGSKGRVQYHSQWCRAMPGIKLLAPSLQGTLLCHGPHNILLLFTMHLAVLVFTEWSFHWKLKIQMGTKNQRQQNLAGFWFL